MTTYHVNTDTGNTGICKAEKGGCPFGTVEEHFDNRNNARKAYEKKQEIFEQFAFKTKMPAQGGHTLATYDPLDERIGVGELWGNPLATEFFKTMAEAAPETRLVLESGQVWQKSSFSYTDSWKFISGDYSQLTGLERGKTYDSSYLMGTIKQYGARLEKGGAVPRMAPEHRADIMPDTVEAEYEAGIIGTHFTKADSAYEAQTLESDLDDYIVERWHGLNPYQRANVREKLIKNLGEPTNLGDETYPSWVWGKTIKGKRP